MKNTNNLVTAALAGLAEAKINSAKVARSAVRTSDNGCNGKGGCGSKQSGCNSKN